MVKTIHRLMQYLKNKDLKQTHFEKLIGVGNGYLSKTDNRNSAIGSDVIEKIAIQCPDLNIDWLITGNGEMLKNDTMANTSLKECMDSKAMLEKLLLEKVNEVERLKGNSKSVPKPELKK